MKRHTFISTLLGAIALAACGDKATQTIASPVLAGANVRFYNFGPNAPGVNFYANDLKLTAITSANCAPPADTTSVCRAAGNESTTGTVYGSLGNGGNYVNLPAGQYTLSGRIAAATDKGLSITSVAAPLAEGKWYSYYVSGIYDATGKKADAFLIEDALPVLDYNQAYIRLVDASPNSTSLTLFAKNTASNVEAAVGTAITYKGQTAFVAVTPGIYDLTVRTAASPTASLVTRTAVSFNPGHIYTVSLRGDVTLPSTGTATNRPTLDVTGNR